MCCALENKPEVKYKNIYSKNKEGSPLIA